MIRFEHIRKEFPDAIPIQDINGEIEDGKIVTIIGPSGTGKTTLLRMINGLERPTSGKIFYNDVEITGKNTNICDIRKEIGMVFQSYNLFNHLTLLENIVAPQMDILKKTRVQAEETAMKLLGAVGLEHAKDKMPSQISGGQKQRVAIARALAMDPKVILFDEPTSALDPQMTTEVAGLLKRLQDGIRTLIIVTHDMQLSEQVSDEVIFLNKGVIFERGTPDQIFHHPERKLTEVFIKQMKSFELNVETAEFDFFEAINAVKDFCVRQQIDFRYWNQIQSVVEELVAQIIDSGEVRKLKFLVVVDEESNKLHYLITYSGSEYDPFKEDSLSTRIVSGFVEDISYNYRSDNKPSNQLRFYSKN